MTNIPQEAVEAAKEIWELFCSGMTGTNWDKRFESIIAKAITKAVERETKKRKTQIRRLNDTWAYTRAMVIEKDAEIARLRKALIEVYGNTPGDEPGVWRN